MNLPTAQPAPATPGGAFAPTLGAPVPQVAPTRALALTRWFGGVALLAISAIAVASVSLLGWLVSERMLAQEGALTRDFVQSVVAVEKPLQAYFAKVATSEVDKLEDAFEHFARMPDVLRTNVYDRERTVLWSSDPQLIGRRFGPNGELDEALAGAVVVEQKTAAERRHGKAEYESLVQPSDRFVEIYVPVRDVDNGRVVGAIEFYKNPRGLFALLAELRRYIAFGAAAFAVLLFAALYGLVRRADRLIQAQQRRLVENETFAAVGEMSSVVAHGIRNPLAVIRSSAELIEDSRDPGTAEAARDIVAQADRLGAWVRELLSYTRLADLRQQPPVQQVALAPLAGSCLAEFGREFERRRIHARSDVAESLPAVQGEAFALGQVLHSLVANALEAVADGGHIVISASHVAERQQLTLCVQDDGPGLSAAQLERVGKPFYTTKAQGMGVGLSLARRVLERHGGTLAIDSEPGQGTVVSVSLRTVAR